MTDPAKTDPATISYPENEHQRDTYMRLKLAKGEKMLTDLDVQRIEAARFKRARKGFSS